MYHTEDILDAAYTIRLYLHNPLQVANAGDLNRHLEQLLQRTDNLDQVADEVMDLLAQYETTAEWMHSFLESDNQERIFQPPPGEVDPPLADIYVCPNGGCRLVIRSIGDSPKRCQKNGEFMGTPVQPWCPSYNTALQKFERKQ